MMRAANPTLRSLVVLSFVLLPIVVSACSSSETAEPNGPGPGVGAGGTGAGGAGAAGEAGAGAGGSGGGGGGEAGAGATSGHGGAGGASGGVGGASGGAGGASGGAGGASGGAGGASGGAGGASGGAGGSEPCVPGQDLDLDTYDDCADCDDLDGSVHPGAIEICDGVDQDCDGVVDNGFDHDNDHYSPCHPDPLLRDCNDFDAGINPGEAEDCGPNGIGNGKDEDCDGYVDEGCVCSGVDDDHDGSNSCEDCDDHDPERAPGLPEVCDGKDNDCNVYTRQSCTTGDPCNFDADQNYNDDPDLCMTDMYCACTVDNDGYCITPYACTAYCNSSTTGPLEDGVGPDEICNRAVIAGANTHLSSAAVDEPGAALSGDGCTLDTDCRSLWCVELCSSCGSYCLDLCASDGYCGPAARCEIWRDISYPVFEGYCMPTAYLGSATVGTSCSDDATCDHRYCMVDPDAPGRYCSEPCCQDADCPAAYSCSLRGGYDEVTVVGHEWWSLGVACSGPADCVGRGESCHNNQCSWRAAETVPMCVRDVAGQGDRTAGQACAANADCRSNFCERTLGVCVEICCADSTCPQGMTCEGQWVELDASHATLARVCMSNAISYVLQPK